MKNFMFMISLFFYSFVLSAQPLTFNRAPTVSDIYQFNGGKLIWFDRFGLTLQAISFSLLMDDLGVEISTPLPFSETNQQGQTIAQRDRAYTKAAIYFLNTIEYSSGESGSYGYSDLVKMAKSNLFPNYVLKFAPPYDEVSRLRDMIRYYKVLAKNRWIDLEAQEFRLGQSNKNILLLRQRLIELRDISAIKQSVYRAAIYDPSLIQGIQHFQKRHGISESGKLDEMTIALLNVTPRERVELMQLNLWRWFELPSILPSRYVRINIPSFELNLLENEDKILTMKVIVGKPQTPTPTMRTALTQVTVNPSWTPPWSIVSKELIPLHAKQPGYLNFQGFRLRKLDDLSYVEIDNISSTSLASLLVNHQLIQSPGAKNALGQYRFSIPNNSAIYLHDTPTKSFFSKLSRAMSHGCIRLANSQGLSDYLMQNDTRSREVHKAVNDKTTRSFKLLQPLPVFITYHTTWVDELGKLQFRDDIYNRDSEG